MSLLDRLRGRDDRTHVPLTLRGGDVVVATRVPHALAWEEWQRRRAASGKTCPLLLAGEPRETTDDETRPSRVLERASTLDLEGDFASVLEEMDLGDNGELELDFDPARLTPHSPWGPEFRLLEDDPVFIVEIPCAESWQIPAYLPFGDWDACPPDEVHCALLRQWQQRFGAELIGMSGDGLELWVPRPIMDPVEAKEVARQQVAYCDDRVTQGLAAYAQSLLGARSWLFSWT